MSENQSNLLREALEHHQAGRLEAACAAYRAIVEQDGAAVDARLKLGMLLNETGRANECIEVLGRLVVDHPKSAAGWVHLAHAIASQGFAWEAHDAVAKGLKLNPDPQTLVAASMVLMTLGNLKSAESACRKALKMKPESAAAWVQLGQVLAANDRTPDAAAAYRRALALDPHHALATFWLAAISAGSGESADAPPAVAPVEYVRQLFDGFAEQFDGSLVGSLQYQAPELLDELLEHKLRVREGGLETPLVMFDAGCGTGLCGVRIARYRGRLIGVDVSPKMIAMAKARAVYDELVVGEVVEELEKRPGALDLIMAGDVLVYMGDLSRLFTAAALALRLRGLFVFSVEATSEADYVLQPSHRFAHSRDYLTRLADGHGFERCVINKAALRLEKGSQVYGYCVLMQRADNGAGG